MPRVPIAVDARLGKLVFPDSATRGNRLSCIGCGGLVHLRAGKIRVRHFAHNHAGGGCGGGEGIVHRCTKEWIAKSVSNPNFVIWCTCSSCKGTFEAFRGNTRFAGVTEINIGANAKYRVDVVCLDGSRCVSCIEVMHTHKTEPDKMAVLASVSYNSAFEVLAVDLIQEQWPLEFHDIRSRRCSECIINYTKNRVRQRTNRVSREMASRWIARVLGNNTAYAQAQRRQEREAERRRRLRKCADCSRYYDVSNMNSYKIPRSKYPEWVCDPCSVNCLLCGSKISKVQSKFGGRCFNCNLERREMITNSAS